VANEYIVRDAKLYQLNCYPERTQRAEGKSLIHLFLTYGLVMGERWSTKMKYLCFGLPSKWKFML